MFLFLSLLGIKSSFAYYQREDFSQKYYWLTRPRIVLCDDAKVSKFDLSSAISFWNRTGYGVSTEIIEKECESDHLLGEIRITSQRDLDLQKYYGFTERKISEEVLFAATIKIEDASSNLKEALKGTDNEDIKKKTETLVQASMKLGEAIYKSQEKKPDSSKDGDKNDEGKKDDNVVDADFEEVKEEVKEEAKEEDKEKSA